MGCSNYKSGKKELFVELGEFVYGEVKFGNNTILPVFDKENNFLLA